jgi:hypothetical protein
MTEPGQEQDRGREPRGLREQVIANCRPRPAIPAVAALFLTVLLPAMSAVTAPDGALSWQLWMIPAGVVLSCALAIAAGFCSLAPQAIWLVGAAWALGLIERAGLPAWHAAIVYLGMAAAVAMIGFQIWRVRTRRFVATWIDEDPDRAED